MRKQSGFSLIELVVAMAVLALIMGAMVHLFGGSVVSLHAGSKQEVVYEEARLVMNELKTTLRYADKDSIKLGEIDGKMSCSYSGTMWNRHMDIGEGKNKDYEITVKWKDDTKKQLEITRKNSPDGKPKTTFFPQDINNSAFTYEDKFDGEFPIVAKTVTLNNGDNVVLYQITLPVQYVLNGKPQLQTLTTKVVPSRDGITETPEEKMRREYMEILSVGLKIAALEKLTSKEEKLRDEVYAFFGKTGSYYLTNNDNIRKYMYEKLYNSAWPSVKLTTASGGITTVYFHPVAHDNANIENTFIMGRDNSLLVNSWVTKSLYDHKRKKWMITNEKAESVMCKNWTELQQWMINHNYQDVTTVEYN